MWPAAKANKPYPVRLWRRHIALHRGEEQDKTGLCSPKGQAHRPEEGPRGSNGQPRLQGQRLRKGREEAKTGTIQQLVRGTRGRDGLGESGMF